MENMRKDVQQNLLNALVANKTFCGAQDHSSLMKQFNNVVQPVMLLHVVELK